MIRKKKKYTFFQRFIENQYSLWPINFMNIKIMNVCQGVCTKYTEKNNEHLRFIMFISPVIFPKFQPIKIEIFS